MPQENQDISTRDTVQGDWIIVSFQKKTTSTRTNSPSKAVSPGINAKKIYADTGKFLNTQKLRYIEKDSLDSSSPDNNVRKST